MTKKVFRKNEPPNEMDHVLPPDFGSDPMSRALKEMMTCKLCAEKDAEIERLKRVGFSCGTLFGFVIGGLITLMVIS